MATAALSLVASPLVFCVGAAASACFLFGIDRTLANSLLTNAENDPDFADLPYEDLDMEDPNSSQLAKIAEKLYEKAGIPYEERPVLKNDLNEKAKIDASIVVRTVNGKKAFFLATTPKLRACLNAAQLEHTLAHEIGHYINGDLTSKRNNPRNVAGLGACFAFAEEFIGGVVNAVMGAPASFPTEDICLAVACMIALCACTAQSRHSEIQADTYACGLGDPLAGISGLAAMSKKGESRSYFNEQAQKRWPNIFFATHPTLRTSVIHMAAVAREQGMADDKVKKALLDALNYDAA